MVGRIPEQFIDDLVARIDIVELIETYLPLRKAGKEFQALCPFHGEKTPSFTVSREKQFYHCFGCGVHGTAIGFLMAYRNLEFLEAVEELADLAGVQVPRDTTDKSLVNSKEVFEVLGEAETFYKKQLRTAASKEKAINYLKNRGISGETAKVFGIGYAPEGWRNLIDNLAKHGIAEEKLARGGLAIKKQTSGYYDRFRDRIIFPIQDKRGRVLGFGGRVLDKSEPKYLNSPETEVFHKGTELYGLKQAVASGQLESLIVVEGYMDVISLYQFGIRNSVATLGTAVTSAHLDKLFRHVSKIVFCFDGDKAGKRAAWKGLELSLPKIQGNRQVEFCFLPEGHDPDSAVRKFGSDRFFAASKVYSLIDYLLDSLKQKLDLSSGEGKANLLATIKPFMEKISDTALKAVAARKISDATKFDENLVRQEIGLIPSVNPRKRINAIRSYTSRSLQEQAIGLILASPSLANQISEAKMGFIRDNLSDCDILFDVWKKCTSENLTTGSLIERFRGTAAEQILLEIATISNYLEEAQSAIELEEVFKKLQSKGVEQQILSIKNLSLGDLTEEQKQLLRGYKK
ncbi:MAG: DNA primase [Gammaproteobacteria bacterium]